VKPIDAADRAHDLRAPGMMARFLLVGMGVWLHAADSLVTATIAPAIVLDLNGIAYINWTISLYQVGAIVAGAAAAAMCARWGIKRVFMGATLIYAGGCVMGAAAPNMGILVLGRLIQGMGGGMLLSLSVPPASPSPCPKARSWARSGARCCRVPASVFAGPPSCSAWCACRSPWIDRWPPRRCRRCKESATPSVPRPWASPPT
jgi:MFS family permease